MMSRRLNDLSNLIRVVAVLNVHRWRWGYCRHGGFSVGLRVLALWLSLVDWRVGGERSLITSEKPAVKEESRGGPQFH